MRWRAAGCQTLPGAIPFPGVANGVLGEEPEGKVEQEAYFATASWDEDAGVWYVSETDFPGLVAEAGTQQELIRKIHRLVPELYAANRHLMDGEFRKDIPIQVTAGRLETIRLATAG